MLGEVWAGDSEDFNGNRVVIDQIKKNRPHKNCGRACTRCVECRETRVEEGQSRGAGSGVANAPIDTFDQTRLFWLCARDFGALGARDFGRCSTGVGHSSRRVTDESGIGGTIDH